MHLTKLGTNAHKKTWAGQHTTRFAQAGCVMLLGVFNLKYLALLRGINVGGKNIISKEDLCQLFIDLGFENVRTYIQSGNILFRSNKKNSKKLAKSIEDALSERFSYSVRAVVISYDKYKTIVESAPDSWGKDNQQNHNALFLLGDATPSQVSSELPSEKFGIEVVSLGEDAIFWSVSKENITKTSYMKLAKLQVYQRVTIRNHNTVFKLLQLFDEIQNKA